MVRLCKPVLAAVVWASAMAAGFPAEPTVRCKLELVARAPLPDNWEEAKKVIAFHCVDCQRFRWGTENGTIFTSAEGNFREVVKKEPAKYVAERPLRGVAKLGSKQFGFVLDHKDKKSAAYDRLYFDLNGNGDLTDDKPIDALPGKGWTASSEMFEKSAFPRMVLPVDVEGRKVDYPLSLVRDYLHRPNYESVSMYLTVDAYRRGEINIDGEKHTIAVLDWNSNGRFDDVLSLPKNPHGTDERLFAVCGDMLLIDPEKLANEDLSWSRPSGEHRQFLGKLAVFGGKCFQVKVSPLGDELTWTPAPVPCGQVASPYVPCHVDLISELGWLDLKFEKSKPAAVPAGQWRLLSYSIPIEKWMPPEKNDKIAAETSRSWSSMLKEAIVGSTSQSPAPPAPLRGPAKLSKISADGAINSTPVTVEAGRTTILKFGPPYKPVVTIERWQDTTYLVLRLQGSNREIVDGLTVNGREPDKPRFTITDPKGKVVAQGDFEYG
ncbi:MAG: hypothetical protein ABSG53_28495 [Thermoguttaceae bacterium]